MIMKFLSKGSYNANFRHVIQWVSVLFPILSYMYVLYIYFYFVIKKKYVEFRT